MSIGGGGGAAIVVMERGLTFFECFSRSLPGPLQLCGRDVHDALLWYFCNTVVFNNATEVFGTKSPFQQFQTALHRNDQEQLHRLALNPGLVHHKAVQEWVLRYHSREPSVSKTPSVWYHSYPQLLKGALLRFFYYHRDYATKPLRLYCKYIFAQLAAEHYRCTVGVAATADAKTAHHHHIRWFYPLKSKEYLDDDGGDVASKHTIVVSQELQGGTFSLLRPPPSVLELSSTPPLLLTPDDDDDDDDDDIVILKDKRPMAQYQHSFVLRVAREEPTASGRKSRVNNVMGRFTSVADNVWRCDFVPPAASLRDDIYQIYPGNDTETFFRLGLNECLCVYCHVCGDDDDDTERFILVASHNLNDQYPFFYAIPNTKAFVVSVGLANRLDQVTKHIERHLLGVFKEIDGGGGNTKTKK